MFSATALRRHSTPQCEFKHVMGNLYLCATSGQAHVCDQNCSQRIFYDNHSDICRLSRRLFPRTEAAMGDMARCDALTCLVSPFCVNGHGRRRMIC